MGSLVSPPPFDPGPSSQVPGDAMCPVLDGRPVAEILFRRPHLLQYHPFRERQFVVVEGSGEDALIPGSNGLLELRHLFGSEVLEIFDIGTKRAAAEQPHRM